MRLALTRTGSALALAAAGLWLVELSGHEATKRKLADERQVSAGLRFINAEQSVEIELYRLQESMGERFCEAAARIAQGESAVNHAPAAHR